MASRLDGKRLLHSALALLPPFASFALVWLLWNLIQPYGWVFFYPAVFISCVLGGLRIGLIATAISTLLVWYFFLPESGSLAIEVRHLLVISVFSASGVALALFHDHLTKARAAVGAKRQLEADLREMTELHQRVRQLANERRMFEALVEQSSDFIGIADAAGTPIYLNPAGRRIVGFPAERSVEDTEILDYYSPDQRSFAADVILKSMIETGQWQGETYFRHWHTGDAIPVSDRHFMIRDPETSQLLGMATITRDISDLRTAQDELRRKNDELVEARAFLENVLESSTEYSIIAKDLERRVLVWNSGATRNYGYEASEVIGRSSDMLHVPDEVRSGMVADLHQRALAAGHAAGFFRRRRKDGSEFLARVMITRRNDAKGHAIGFLVVSHDVTAEQRHVREQRFLAEVGEALQASLDYAATVERILQLVTGFMGDACAVDIVEEDGTLRRLRVVCPANEPLAEALERILPDRGHPIWTVLETRRALLLPEVTHELLCAFAKNEEHLRLLETLDPQSAILVPLVARSRIIAVLSVVSCQEDRRYTAEDLVLAEELARRASLALDNARLYEVAQRAIQVRDQVLGIVAHDLRNPLGAILMQATLLRPRRGQEERRSSMPADRIERAANRMNRIIRDLLDATRIDAGRLAIEPARVHTPRVVSESVEAQRQLVASASIELAMDLMDDLPDVWADRDRLLQVFENLIGNAVKFTEPGGRIVVGASSQEQHVLFWVNDTGSGITAANLPRVFERHWQAEDVRGRGAGLGLPIVKGIVEGHGGRIWVESTPGVGSTFFFTIPTARGREEWAA